MQFSMLALLGLCVVMTHSFIPPAFADRPPIPLTDAVATDVVQTRDGHDIKLEFGTTNPWPNIRCDAPAGTPWNWSSHGSMILSMTNPTAADETFYVRVDDDVTADGSKHCITASGTVRANATQMFYLSLTAPDIREAGGMRAAPPTALSDLGEPLSCSGAIEPSHVVSFQIFRARPTAPAQIILHGISLSDQAATQSLDRLVDQFGQYTRADWPGKVHEERDLASQMNVERADLQAHLGPAERDEWGGWTGAPKQKATGFFRTEQIDGRWWLVDPDGRLFLSAGIDVVAHNAPTVIEGRESMFTWLPDKNDPLAAFYGRIDTGYIAGHLYHGNTFNFYGANLARKYGTDYDTQFRDTAVSRLRSWGFNTIGNWSNDRTWRKSSFPYVATVGAWGSFARVPSGEDYWGQMPDPFDPEFTRAADMSIRYKAREVNGDASCIGYFFDNELSWGAGDDDAHHYGLAYGALSLTTASPAKRAFLAQLHARYSTVDALNAAWGSSLKSWSDLEAPYNAPAPLASDAQRNDFSAFLTLFAEKYFSTVSAAIKQYDADHLYLGCRFAWFTPEAVKAASKFVNVISFNIYNWQETKYQFAESLGKPLIVGEFHFGALDRGMFSGGLGPVQNQTQRGTSYADYVATVLSEPAFVGTHWFEYCDEPTLGRAGDGENYNIGFVSITDTPYPELIASARNTNAKIYALHQAAKPLR